MNPTNLGAIFRSAAALGMDAVLLTPGCSDPLYRRSARVSMGTVFQVPWAHIGEEMSQWPNPGMEWLHEMGFATAAMALRDDSVSIDDPELMAEAKLAIVLGTEDRPYPHVPRGGFPQRGGSQRRGLLAAGKSIINQKACPRCITAEDRLFPFYQA